MIIVRDDIMVFPLIMPRSGRDAQTIHSSSVHFEERSGIDLPIIVPNDYWHL
jgi:hypothetical protein